MLTERGKRLFKRNQEIYELFMTNTDRVEMCNKFGISRGAIASAVYQQERHIKNYNDKDNYIYRKFFDNEEIELDMYVLTRFSNAIMFKYKKEDQLVQALKDGSIYKARCVGKKCVELLKIIYKI